MSTTPMHRPFLVGPTSIDPSPAEQDDEYRGLEGQSHWDRSKMHSGLHLVPGTRRSKTTLSGPFQSSYKIAAAAAALLLVLTIV